jgi:hypothetical protein
VPRPVATLLVLTSVWCAPAAAQDWLGDPPGGDVSMSATHTQAVEAWGDNANGDPEDDNFVVLIDRLNLKGKVGGFTSYARVDGFGFLKWPRPDIPGFQEDYKTQIRLERVGLNFQRSGMSFTVGDFYEQLGSGLALSVRKLPEAGVDVSLFGVRGSWVGDKNAVTVFAGRANAANMDSVNRKAVDDQHDLLAGGVYEMFPVSGTRLGFYGLYNQPQESVIPDQAQDFGGNTGAYVDLPSIADWYSAYAEAVMQVRFLGGNPQLGSAAYVTQVVRFWELVFSLELLMLNAFEQKGSRNSALGVRFDYNRPPTLERLDQEVLNNRDTAGARFRIEWFSDALQVLVFANLMVRMNDPLEERRLFQTHDYAGVEYSYDGGQSRIAASLGYRHEQQLNQPEPIKTAFLVDVDWLHTLGGGWATHLSTQTQFRSFEGQPHPWGSTFIGLEKQGLGGVTYELGYNGFDRRPAVRRLFHALIGQWEVSERVTLRGIVGTQRGGLKCVAGICRLWPAFSGVQAVAISRF